MYVKNGTGILKRVLVSEPLYLKAAKINEIAKKWDYELKIEQMMEEHASFVKAYRDNGVEVEFLDANECRPNSVFSRDFGGCVKEGYIMGRFRLPLRYQEHTDYEGKMKALGIPKIAEVKEGLFEGGDFMFLNEKTIAVGMLDRTNEKGVAEIREQLAPYGYEVLGVQSKPEYLHLDMMFNLVDDHLAVSYEAGLPEEFRSWVKAHEIEIIPVEEAAIFKHGCNLQALGNHKVMSLKQNVQVNRELEKRGMTVVELDITEILKAGGGPHCMTFPLERI